MKSITINFERLINKANKLRSELLKDRKDTYNSRVIMQSIDQNISSLNKSIDINDRINILQYVYKLENSVSKAESQLRRINYKCESI